MTPKEKRLLDYVGQYIDQNGYAPSYDEMRIEMGLSTKSGVARLVQSLKQQGQLAEIVPGSIRSRNLCVARPELVSFSDAELLDELKRRRAL
jgi:SOS-response transcriptional repressor LexA